MLTTRFYLTEAVNKVRPQEHKALLQVGVDGFIEHWFFLSTLAASFLPGASQYDLRSVEQSEDELALLAIVGGKNLY